MVKIVKGDAAQLLRELNRTRAEFAEEKEDTEAALVELAELIAAQDDALVEIAELIAEEE